MSIEHEDELDEFSVPLDRGMRLVTDAERTSFRPADADALQDRLEDFDAVRTRGEVESRSARLGGRILH